MIRECFSLNYKLFMLDHEYSLVGYTVGQYSWQRDVDSLKIDKVTPMKKWQGDFVYRENGILLLIARYDNELNGYNS